MNWGLFNSQINESWSLFNDLNLSGDRIFHPKYPKNIANYFRGLKYENIWKESYKEAFYNFSLSDNSFFQFHMYSPKPLKVSYYFFDCPYEGLSYKDFLFEEFGNGLDSKEIKQIGDSFRVEYELYLMSLGVKESVNPIRYDLDQESYNRGIHPVSHMHIGHGNSSRVCVMKKLKPLSFVLFIIRQYYPDYWLTIIQNNSSPILKNVREDLDEIEEEFFDVLDQHEMHLY